MARPLGSAECYASYRITYHLIHYGKAAVVVILVILLKPKKNSYLSSHEHSQLKSRTLNACGPGNVKAAMEFFEVRWNQILWAVKWYKCRHLHPGDSHLICTLVKEYFRPLL